MAGRGTDILLGGNPSLMAKLRVRDGRASTLALAVAPGDAGEAAEAEAAKAPAADLETRASPRLVTMDAGFYPVEISAEAEALVETAKGLLLEDGEFEAALELEEVVSIAAAGR